MSVGFLLSIFMVVSSGNELPVPESRSHDEDDKYHVDIPAGTTRITSDSWKGWGVDKKKVTSVTIPDSVTEFGPEAFAHCVSLAAVTIPSSVKKIGERAFAGCSSLTAVTIPCSVTVIERQAFA